MPVLLRRPSLCRCSALDRPFFASPSTCSATDSMSRKYFGWQVSVFPFHARRVDRRTRSSFSSRALSEENFSMGGLRCRFLFFLRPSQNVLRPAKRGNYCRRECDQNATPLVSRLIEGADFLHFKSSQPKTDSAGSASAGSGRASHPSRPDTRS
jgi:hypothetical protein